MFKLFFPVECARKWLSWKAYKRASAKKKPKEPLNKQDFGLGLRPHARLRFVQSGFCLCCFVILSLARGTPTHCEWGLALQHIASGDSHHSTPLPPLQHIASGDSHSDTLQLHHRPCRFGRGPWGCATTSFHQDVLAVQRTVLRHFRHMPEVDRVGMDWRRFYCSRPDQLFQHVEREDHLPRLHSNRKGN